MSEAGWTPDAGICLPVLDEAASLGPLLDEIASCLGGAEYTVCVVDDGSTDGTVELVRRASARDPRIVLIERGREGTGCRRGSATRAGLGWLLANTERRFFVDFDADGSNAPGELLAGLRQVALLGADVAIASAYAPGSRVLGRSLLRRLGSRVYSGLMRTLMDPAIRDYSNSYRFYTRAAAQLLLRFEPGHASPVYLTEMLAIWLSQGLRIVEIPTVYGERKAGSSKIGLGDFGEGVIGAVRVGLRYRAGRYRLPQG